jgi:hypothetical protein
MIFQPLAVEAFAVALGPVSAENVFAEKLLERDIGRIDELSYGAAAERIIDLWRTW